MEERNRACDCGNRGGERSHLVVRYQMRERSVAVTEQRDENQREGWRGRPKR